MSGGHVLHVERGEDEIELSQKRSIDADARLFGDLDVEPVEASELSFDHESSGAVPIDEQQPCTIHTYIVLTTT